jgi:hypothetical protein
MFMFARLRVAGAAASSGQPALGRSGRWPFRAYPAWEVYSRMS